MGDISEHFSRSEHSCKCGCGFDTVDVELNTLLEHIRNYYNKPVTITGPNRCAAHNAAIGGARRSLHMEGKAADIVVKDTSPGAVYTYLSRKFQNKYGFGLYENWIHVDVRATRARWHGAN